MKTMRRLSAVAFMATFIISSCQQETFEGSPDSSNYYASVETFGTGTRAALGENRSVVWSSEDRIAIFEGKDVGQAYQVLDSYVGKSSGEFAEVEDLMTEGIGAAIDGTVAVYPFNEGLTVTSGDNGDYLIEGVTFPSEQKYVAGSFSDEAFPMVAVTSNKNLSFKNVGGVLKLSLTGSYSVSSITLTGNSGEPLSGPATVTLGSDGIPSVTMSDDASASVTLVCEPAVQLDPETATEFYISTFPTDFELGFKITILDENGKEHGLATHKRNSVERSSILAMPETTPDNIDDIELTADTFCSVDFIEGWTETRFGGDGTIIFVKKNAQGRMTNSLMFLPDKENILMPVFIRFDANEIPSYLSFMDTEIYIDGYTDSTIDFTLAVKDAVWSIKDVAFNELTPYSLKTKAWADNNAIRNVCAIGNLIVGVSGVAGGVVMISASGIGAAITVGTSVPVSVAGIALGVMNIKGGCDSITSSLETIFGPAEKDQSTYVIDALMGIGVEKLSDAIQDAPMNDFIKSILPPSVLKDPADLGKLGAISYWSGFIFSSIDEEWGQTYTGPANLAQIHKEVNVVTGRADNITNDSAELYGYVSPLATAPFGDRILTEIYIVLWKAGDENNKKHHSIFNSDGGIVSFKFINLEPDTEYCYQTIFEDIENKIYRFGEIKTFKTLGKPTCETGDASNITTMSAVVECIYSNVPDDGQCQVILSWDDGHKIVKAENREGTQSITLNGLEPNTTYSYCACIDYEGGPVNGESKEFTTKEDDVKLRNMLISLYNNTDGDNWYCNENWCTDSPLDTWWGISYQGEQIQIDLSNNNLSGRIYWNDRQCNTLFSMDVSDNPNLKSIVITDCDAITSLSVSDCSNLELINCYYTGLISLSVANCHNVYGINCFQNQLQSLIISNCSNLDHLDCDFNKLNSLNLSSCNRLRKISCYSNRLQSIAFLNKNSCPNLKELYIEGNPMNQVITPECMQLDVLACDWKYKYRRERVYDPEADEYKCKFYHITNPYGWWFEGEPESKYKKHYEGCNDSHVE